MTGTFTQRIDELEKRIGTGTLTGTVVCDQLYAHRQHEDMSYRHPRGGGAKYLEKPLMDHYRDYLTDYAHTVLDDGGQSAMKRSVEHLSDQVEVTAPVLDGDLRRSGHPSVSQGGRSLYDRPPKAPRLSEEQLRAKSRKALRERWNAGLDVFWTKGGKVIHVPAGGKRKPW